MVAVLLTALAFGAGPEFVEFRPDLTKQGIAASSGFRGVTVETELPPTRRQPMRTPDRLQMRPIPQRPDVPGTHPLLPGSTRPKKRISNGI